jgi:DNA-binding response OmpR family regulator
MRTLVIESDPKMAGFLQRGLEEELHVVSVASNGRNGLELARSYQFDVIVLDWMLPEVDGLRVTRHLRMAGNATPIVMLGKRDPACDVVRALDAGVDDYLTKPFALPEFLARLRAVIRRPSADHKNRIEIADLVLDSGTRQVFRGKHEIRLTMTEYKLLEFLMRRSGSVSSRRAIVEAVWGHEADVEENTLDAFVRRLRSKVDHGHIERLIHTMKGFGYYVQRDVCRSAIKSS